MLHDFLLKNRDQILAMTERKSLALAGARPSSEQLKNGLPIFYEQLMAVLRTAPKLPSKAAVDQAARVSAAYDSDEKGIARAGGYPDEVAVAAEAEAHGTELLRLGYSLSHVVHAYGAMCQSITELAGAKQGQITASEFHDMNRCLDIAIAGAVTGYQAVSKAKESDREIEHLGFLAHELRNALTSVSVSFQLVKAGQVGVTGHTGRLIEVGLRRIEDLIDRSLTEVRLRVDPEVHAESFELRELVDQIVTTAGRDAFLRKQSLELHIDPSIILEADHQLIHSAISNLIQNALKYTPDRGKIRVCGFEKNAEVVIEVEDECGGLRTESTEALFKAFAQRHENREGLGLGLTIAQRAVRLNGGSIGVREVPGKGCIFRITLPRTSGKSGEVPTLRVV